MNDDLKWIKKNFGEAMAHLCRELFPTILETKGLLPEILDSSFSHSEYLCEDIVEQDKIADFKNYIYHLYSLMQETEELKLDNVPEPQVLLDRIGYDLYECHSEEDIQKFKKYYAPGEELCTFRGERLKSCYVFFAVKKNVDKIKREDFTIPERQDEYGTSVISIQFTRGDINTLSIKNRYNHVVNNPDATFSNNLDNIVEGLTQSFEEKYEFKILGNKGKFELDNYVMAEDKKFYRYNFEDLDAYYCPNNIVIDHFKVNKFDNNVLLFENYIIDLKNKTLNLYNSDNVSPSSIRARQNENNSFVNIHKGIKKIEIEKDGLNKIIKLYLEDYGVPVEIKINKYNRIIGYKNDNVVEIGQAFLANQITELEELSLPNVKKISHYFLSDNRKLKELSLPNVETIGSRFMIMNMIIKKISLPNLKYVGDRFLERNTQLTKLDLPKLREIDTGFLKFNPNIKSVFLPNLRIIGDDFLRGNIYLNKLDLPSLVVAGSDFLHDNVYLSELNLPKLKKAKSGFLHCNTELKKVFLPLIEEIEGKFLINNTVLNEISLPKVKKIGWNFLLNNRDLEKIDAPLLEEVDSDFLYTNQKLKSLFLPNLKKVGDCFLYNNLFINSFDLPKLEVIGNSFLTYSQYFRQISLPSLKQVGDDFMSHSSYITIINLPLVEKIGSNFLVANVHVSNMYLPKLKEVGNGFLYTNEYLKNLSLPSLKIVGNDFISYNKIIDTVDLRNLKEVGKNFLGNNQAIEELYLPKLVKVGDNFIKYDASLNFFEAPKLKSIGDSFLYFALSKKVENECLKKYKKVMSSNVN